MPLNAGLLLRVLTLGVLVVPILGLKFNFTQVDQCGPAVITFTGNSISTVPASLTILPLNSTAIDFPLQNPDYVSSGISLSPLPLVAGTIFLASLDNASGENLIPISDLIRVLPSEDSGCLSRPDFSAPRRFSIGPTVAQCEDLTIRYDTSVVSKGPAVRLYAPRGVSFLLGQTADDPVHGIATYTLNAIRGIQVLFLIDDGSNIRETSPLLTVTGDASSDRSCFQRNATSTMNMMTNNTINTPDTSGTNSPEAGGTRSDSPVVSKAIIIGSVTAGIVIFLIAIGMVVFAVMDRRRRRLQQTSVDPSSMEKAMNDEKPSRGGSPIQRSSQLMDSATALNPIYTKKSFLSVATSNKSTSNRDRGSMASWTQAVPEDQKYPASTSSPPPIPNTQIEVISPSSPYFSEQPGRQSLESLDIEGMLNMAMLQSENMSVSRKNSDVSILGPIMRVPSPIPVASSVVASPPPTFLRPETSRRQLRNIPSDVSPGPTSITFSGYSINPFDSHDVVFQEPLRTGDSFKSPVAGLPRSPRDSDLTKAKMLSGGSGRASSDWYGIAR